MNLPPYRHLNPIWFAMQEWQKEFMQQERDINLLTAGAARQAETIRTLNERNSSQEADLNLSRYNEEFLKQQARKTRLKTREYRKQRNTLRDDLKAAQAEIAELRELLEQSERTIGEQRANIRELDSRVVNQAKLVQRHQDAIERMQRGKELSIQYVTQRDPFVAERLADVIPTSPTFQMTGTPYRPATVRHIERDVVRVVQTAAAFHIAPEHRRDVRAHAEVAQMLARSMVPKIEQSILNALRGEETAMPDLRALQAEERYQRLRQAPEYALLDFVHNGSDF